MGLKRSVGSRTVRRAVRAKLSAAKATETAAKPVEPGSESGAPATPVVYAVSPGRHILSELEASALADDLGPLLFRISTIVPQKLPKRPPIPMARKRSPIRPNNLELRHDNVGWVHVLDGHTLATGDTLEVRDASTWHAGLYGWNGHPLHKPRLLYTRFMRGHATCPLARDRELRFVAPARFPLPADAVAMVTGEGPARATSKARPQDENYLTIVEQDVVLLQATSGLGFSTLEDVVFDALWAARTVRRKGTVWLAFGASNKPHYMGKSSWIGLSKSIPLSVVTAIQTALVAAGHEVDREMGRALRLKLLPFARLSEDGLEILVPAALVGDPGKKRTIQRGTSEPTARGFYVQ